MKRFKDRLNTLYHDAEWHLAFKWIVLSGIVGLIAGFGAIFFHWASEELFTLAMQHWAGYHPRPAGKAVPELLSSSIKPGLIVLLPTIGGLLSGWIVFTYAPEAEGHGTDAALETYHRKGGIIAWHVPIVKTIASILTLGLGGSGGREGPIAQIGAGFGSFLAQKLGLSARDRRVLMAAGMGAGVGAIFRAPLAGALFAAEIHYREPEFEADAIIPGAIASIVAYCVFSLHYGWDSLFATGEFSFHNPMELLPYTLLAFGVAAGAHLFVRIFYGFRDFFAALNFPQKLKPALGGFMTGLTGLGLYFAFGTTEVLSVMGFGYGTLQGAIDSKVPILLLLVVAGGKMFTTGMTIGSGGSGGVFGPSMVIGGAIGGAIGLFLQGLFPELVTNPGAYVLVGMAGFFAGAAKTPISTIIMVSEMTGNYNLLLPALWVSTLCYLLLRRTALYEKQIRSPVDSPAHRGEFHIDVLEDIKVADVYNKSAEVLTFPESEHLGDILHRLSGTHQSFFPITNSEGKMVGIFSLNDIREFMYDDSIWDIAIAADIAVKNVLRVTPDDDLNTAIRRFTRRNIDELPVVKSDDRDVVVGLLRRKEVIDIYNRKLWTIRHEHERMDDEEKTNS
ncbi:chloride channel protein [Myxococcota bacterium]|nr:chloride channel protein [Myxococcota bacterium]